MTVACRECRYYQRVGETDFGKCRRRSPFTLGMFADRKGYWPEVTAEDWCGEFATRFIAPHNEKRPDDSRAMPQ